MELVVASTLEEAAWARDIAARVAYGEFAVLNHPGWAECFEYECAYDDIREQLSML